jgi:ADP-heptose:LPS heptosyltransferase
MDRDYNYIIMMKKICIIRMGALGDVIMTSPIVRAVYEHFNGECKITIITKSEPVFDNSPYVHEVLSQGTDPSAYDIVIGLDLAYERRPHSHTVDAYLEVAQEQIPDLKMLSKKLDLFSDYVDQTFVDNWPEIYRIQDFIVLHMRRTGWESRNIPSTFWSKVVAGVLEKTNLTIVQIGLDNDIYFGGNDRLKILKNMSIQQVAELIKRSKAFVGVDTSTLHIAASTDVPIISVFTSAHHEFRKPLRDESKFFPIIPQNLDCYGCLKDIPAPATTMTCRRGDMACLSDINPEHVIQSLLEVI